MLLAKPDLQKVVPPLTHPPKEEKQNRGCGKSHISPEIWSQITEEVNWV